MVMFYLLIGFFLLLAPGYFQGFKDSYRIVFGSAVVLYGFFRGYTVYKRFREDSENDDDEEENNA